jgi:tetratricopeptide (TPR) repeat protein
MRSGTLVSACTDAAREPVIMAQPKDDKTNSAGGLSAREVFASEETIHRLMDRVDGVGPRSESASLWHPTIGKVIIAANVVLAIALLVYLNVFHAKTPAVVPPAHTAEAAAPAANVASTPEDQAGSASEASISNDPQAAALFAQDLYEKGQFEKARHCYVVLRKKLSTETGPARLLADYMQFKAALCQQKLNKQQEATKLLAECAGSASPVVSAMANYRIAVAEMHAERYAVARMRLYNVLAIVGAMPEELQASFEKECSFMLAQATVGRFWQAIDLKAEMPAGTWERPVLEDPAAKLGYDELLQFIAKDDDLIPATPVVAQNPNLTDKALSRWNIAARGAPVYDLLSELGTKAAFGIRWEASDADKNKKVTVHLAEKSPDTATEIIAGCAGLMTGVKNGIPTVANPESAAMRDDQKRMYSTEAIALLNRFILLHTQDEATPTAYFLVGLIHEQTGAATAAISDYKIIASRYESSPLAQYALWNSSRIKLALRDTAAARADLTQILDLNQNHAIYSQAAMRLAQLMYADGMYKDSDRLFRKVYSTSPPPDIQAASALGAARCLFSLENNFEASEWFTRYIQLEKNRKSADLFDAAVDLGVCFRRMGKLKQSAEALRFALMRELTTEQRTQASIELARTEIEAESYVKALAALQNLPVTPNLTDDEVTVLLLNAQISCEIGMPEKAAIALQNAVDRAYNKERTSKLASALAEAYIQMGAADKAASALEKMLGGIQSSPSYGEVSCRLAEVDLVLGRNTEAISLCTGLLSMKPSDEVMDRAFRIIGKAYTNMKQYDKAALAYAGRISPDGGQGI